MTFSSLNKTTCNVYIYDEGWTGSVTELIPAAEPFEYEEENDESLLTVLRYRTGYLRVVEDTYGSLEDLYPATATDRYVEFYYGERLDFVGYLQVQSFANDWVASPRVLDFPIISPLGLTVSKRFPTYDFVSPQSLLGLLDTIVIDLNGTSGNDGKYNGVIFPDVTGAPGLEGKVNGLTYSPFNSEFKHADPDSPPFEGAYYSDIIEAICNAYGWVIHDIPGTLLFTRFDYNGSYASYDLPIVSLPTKETVGDYGGGNVKKVINSYTPRDASATDGVIMPFKRIFINYTGNDTKKVEMSLARTYYQSKSGDSGYFGGHGERPDPDTYAVAAWLKAADDEFEGAQLKDSTTLDNDGELSEPGVFLTCAGSGEEYHERILIGWTQVWTTGSDLFSVKFYEHPSGDVWMNMKFTWGVYVYDLKVDETAITFLAIKFAFMIYVWDGVNTTYMQSDGTWNSTSYTFLMTPDNNGEIKFGIKNLPAKGELSIKFVVPDTTQTAIPTHYILSVESISIAPEPLRFEQYTTIVTDTDTIEGTQGEEEASIDQPLTCYRENGGLIGDTVISTKFTEYPYLLAPQRRVVCKFTCQDYDLLATYITKWQFWIKQWRWRIVALSFNPWNDEYTLTLHRSPSIETRMYLADVDDNVFQSIDDYLFTVMANQTQDDPAPTPPDPPTPVLPYDAQVEYLNLPAGAYFDSGIIPSNTHGMQMDVLHTGTTTAGLGGSRNDSTHRWFFSSGATIYIGWGGTAHNAGSNNGSRHTLEMNLYNSRKAGINGANSISLSTLGYTPTYSAYIGAMNNNSTMQASRLWAAKITNGSDLVFDGIPVRKNGVGCLYDRVTGTLFENIGTGTITYGNDVTE